MINEYFDLLLSFIYLFNIKRSIEKILQVHLNLLKSLYVFLLSEMAPAIMLDKMIYSRKEINEVKKIFKKVR